MPSPPLPAPPAIAPAAVLRWGQGALWAALVGGLALTLALAAWAPEAVLLVPLALVAATGGVWVFRYPLVNLGLLLGTVVAFLDFEEGLQPAEIAWGLYFLAFLGHWYGGRLLRGEPFVRSTLDRVAAFTIVGGLTGGVALGLLFGAPFGAIRGEATAFLMLALYFPVKEACRQDRRGALLVLGVAVWIGCFIAVRDFLNFRSLILLATQAWEVADARLSQNEMPMLIPSLSLLVLLLHGRGWGRQLGLLALFLLITAALVMTKSRGYWIDFLFGVGILLVLLRGRFRWRLVVFVFGGFAVAAVVAMVFLGDLATLVFSGTASRFATLESALTKDVSLVNRFNEAAAVLEKVRVNPILGHGFGTEYRFYDWVFQVTYVGSFIHNGYVALWYKLGVWGLALVLALWGGAAWQGLRVYWTEHVPRLHRLIGLCMGLTLLSIIPSASTSNPFILMDQVFVFALQVSVAAGLYQRHLGEGALVPPPATPAATPAR